MISAGNDIVALKLVDKLRTGEFRFYSKILTISEQSLFHQAAFETIPFEHYVWLLWSVKESAYKYLKRTIPDLLFSPARFVLQHIKIPASAAMPAHECKQWENSADDPELYSGTVIYESYTIFFRSKISKDWIATVVNEEENFDYVCWGIQSIEDNSSSHQSAAARSLLLKKLIPFFPGPLQIAKNAIGYPEIRSGKQNLQIPASLSHDGHFVAFSFVSVSNNKISPTWHFSAWQ